MEISPPDIDLAKLRAARERRRQKRREAAAQAEAAVDLLAEPDDLLADIRNDVAKLVAKHKGMAHGGSKRRGRGAPAAPAEIAIWHNPKSMPESPLYERFVAAWEAVPNKTIQLVFHGTDQANIHWICKDGLDPARRNGQAHGAGEYFGATMQVSQGYNRNSPHMLIFAVLLDRSGLTTANQQMVVVNKAEHQLPLAVVTMRGRPYAPPPGWLDTTSNPHDTGRAALAPSHQAALLAQQAALLAGARVPPGVPHAARSAWTMAQARAALAGSGGLAALAALGAVAGGPGLVGGAFAAAAGAGGIWLGPQGRPAAPPPVQARGTSSGKRRKRS